MMANEAGARPLLPQAAHVQNFLFAPPTTGPRENQKNYVFVDEHNRHKRLKVMRACEGCRRRKIKCDAATTNAWPCSACVRLKLHCIPPSLTSDPDLGHGPTGYEPEPSQEPVPLDDGGPGRYTQQATPPAPFFLSRRTSGREALAEHVPYHESGGPYSASLFASHTTDQDAPLHLSYGSIGEPVLGALEPSYHSSMLPARPSMHPVAATAATASSDSWQSESYSTENLSDALGELKIDESGVAPYISQQKRSLAEAPAQEEFDEFLRNLPPPSGPDFTVRIPPELMPSEQQALHYFDIFFKHVHPYVPVINQVYFYQQWHTNRRSISPLILEAIFACAGGMSEDPTQGSRWLALAGKHADCFMDVPRLSTVQALLLILKARENFPKRGYYFRSWMTIVMLIDMAKDLELDEHLAFHQQSIPCGSTYNDCVTKTRIWQTLFICELMIGAPQGRSDLQVDPHTVDFSVPRPSLALDEYDLRIARNWVYMGRVIMCVRRMNDVVAKVKKKKDWGHDVRWVELSPFFTAWLEELPADLRVAYPADGSPPWLSSHFQGNLHSYYELSLIMLHRPQLAASDSFAIDGDWKRHMVLCYTAAKKMCRLQEGIVAQFGLAGHRCMQRGLGFTIYAILTCTVLHLVAITSPDPELNVDATDYFSRHMRVLELCISTYPIPHVQAQVDALREAFSADTSQPFVLKRSFPYSSPPLSQLAMPPPPPSSSSLYHPSQSRAESVAVGGGVGAVGHGGGASAPLDYLGHPISPPPSTTGIHSNGNSPTPPSSSSGVGAGLEEPTSMPSMAPAAPMVEPVAWNPSRIFDQWNTAFGTPDSLANPAPTAPSAASAAYGSHPLAQDLTQLQDITLTSGHNHSHSHSSTAAANHAPPTMPTMTFGAGSAGSSGPAPPAPPSLPTTFVSPSMWQSSVAAVWEGGLKSNNGRVHNHSHGLNHGHRHLGHGHAHIGHSHGHSLGAHATHPGHAGGHWEMAGGPTPSSTTPTTPVLGSTTTTTSMMDQVMQRAAQ